MLPNIVLIGFMGSGKSSVGRKLANLTGHRFIDTDKLIINRMGQPITAIFKNHGEAYFRKLETEELAKLVGLAGIVLATGGGVPTREENCEILHKIGPVAWLDADPEKVFERVSRNKRRPLLQTENPRKTFDELLQKRLSFYEKASDFRIDSSKLKHHQVARHVLDETMRYMARRPKSPSEN
ncbi:MAG: shikimate kinase [Chthoniobacterales bacterium]